VRLGPSTPGDYVRARVLVPRNPGVTTTDGGAPPESSDGDAPEAGGQATTMLPKRTSSGGTPGLVPMAVARGAVGIGNGGGGHEGRVSLWRSREARTSLATVATRRVGGSGVLRRPILPIRWIWRCPWI
jgi:hypothetical protein